jgi:DNA-binding NarL/FixJ family response regulator
MLLTDIAFSTLYHFFRSSNLENESPHRIASSHGGRSRPCWRAVVTTAPQVLLADDQEEIRQTVALILGAEFDIVGWAENGLRAVDLATRLSPDVLVLDISMPVVNGIEAACYLKELGSPARVVFLTVHSDPEFVEAALSAGALGYVLKPFLATDLVPAIWAAMQGHTFISPSMQ